MCTRTLKIVIISLLFPLTCYSQAYSVNIIGAENGPTDRIARSYFATGTGNSKISLFAGGNFLSKDSDRVINLLHNSNNKQLLLTNEVLSRGDVVNKLRLPVLGYVGKSPFLIVSSRPVSIDDLLNSARLKLSHGGSGHSEFCASYIKKNINKNITVVSSGNTAMAIADLMKGNVDLYCDSSNALSRLLQGGGLSIVLVSGDQPLSSNLQAPLAANLKSIEFDVSSLTTIYGGEGLSNDEKKLLSNFIKDTNPVFFKTNDKKYEIFPVGLLFANKGVKEEINVSQESLSKLDDAKRKCVSIGFKIGTESFGNCVLKLSK